MSPVALGLTRDGNVTPMPEPSILSVLRERASLQPNDIAFTYTDYEHDWAGVVENLTWSQLYRRTRNLADELAGHGSVGDRAVILAPQGLDYVVAFLGAMQAGLVAVPLPVPQIGSHDERVSAVLADTAPAVVLTTATVTDGVAEYVREASADALPAIVEIDSLDLDSPRTKVAGAADLPGTAYLQYTSGSTRLPAGVMISHRNLQVNFEQLMLDFFEHMHGFAPPETTLVSWLPFYHDMGLVLGVVAPILGGFRAELTSPIAFLQRPVRWIQALAGNSPAWSGAPNFAFDLTARKTTDADMAGLDLSGVLGIISGSERINPATLKRFTDRFAPFNFQDHMVRPSYGLAEATVFVTSGNSGRPPEVVHFESSQLAVGTARRCGPKGGTPLLRYGIPKSPTLRIVDSDTDRECPHGSIGEIWVHGANVADGYWRKPEETERTFGAQLVDASPGTPDGPWLRTGDLGFISDDDLFIVGRVKDLLIVYGRNHYPEDIEATVHQITRGRVAAISVPTAHTEKLVTIIELKNRDADDWLNSVKNDVTSAISKSHGLNVADLVLVPPGSIPTTTSGKIRRAACVEQYRQAQFTRLDA